MKIIIAQFNPVIGAINDNAHRILEWCNKAHQKDAELIIFPELSLIGYPPRDLLLRDDVINSVNLNLKKIADNTPIKAIVGAPTKAHLAKRLYNSAVLCFEAKVEAIAHKRLLPNYNVFDERRYFESPLNNACQFLQLNTQRFLITICEDAWNSLPLPELEPYSFDPISQALKDKPKLDAIINISASPYSLTKPALRNAIFSNLAKKYQSPVLVCGQVGANDQILFDGHSMILNKEGNLLKSAKACSEDMIEYELGDANKASALNLSSDLSLLLDALVMGIRDYCKKCGAPGVLLGLSGGIDSAVVACLAFLALGKEKTHSYYLPSKFSSQSSFDDAQALAQNLGINFSSIAIENIVEQLRNDLAKSLTNNKNSDIVDQNLQSRIRGLMLMALSNSSDNLMLATSNKSELAVGYATLYGDMCGAMSPIGDLYKTEVWRLAKFINNKYNLIPENIINKPPTAELKANQLDQDILPDYHTLDMILRRFIEQEQNVEQIVTECKLEHSLVKKVIQMVNNSEFKRRQAPFALMCSNKVFGDARRLPIAKRISF